MFKTWLNMQSDEKIQALTKECRTIYNCGMYSEKFAPQMTEFVKIIMEKHPQMSQETAEKQAFLAVVFKTAGLY